jgi:hypothetical protein
MFFLPLQGYGFDPPANCGQKYAHLVVTGDGYGPTNPTGYKPWASEADIKNWQVPAQQIFDLARAKWNALKQAEHASGNYSASNRIHDYVTLYETNYAALPEPHAWQVAGQDKAVGEYVKSCQMGACVLELIDVAAESVGGTSPIPVPWGPSDTGGSGWMLAIVFGLLAWAYFSERKGSA